MKPNPFGAVCFDIAGSGVDTKNSVRLVGAASRLDAQKQWQVTYEREFAGLHWRCVVHLTKFMAMETEVGISRKFPVGAEITADGVHFRVWAPKRKRVEVVFARGKPVELDAEEHGYFSGLVTNARAGDRYLYRLDDGEKSFPDPASRFQPEGPHGWSEVVYPQSYEWKDAAWKGVCLEGSVIYEIHVGTFTKEGTYRGAIEKLERLKDMGITVIEIMPLAEFAGEFGWGYDGVDFYAPSHLYGRPDDLRAFIDAAHALGIGVILDVVYNHFGPAGCYLKEFSDDYFTDKYENEWGEPLNFDGRNKEQAREFYTANAAYWIDEFHFDGLRLDATQQIFDDSPRHILIEIGDAVRKAANGRETIIVSENEEQKSKLARAVEKGGYGLDGLWNDDFHHAAVVALTGHKEAYYTDYYGKSQEFISAMKYGYLYQGTFYSWQKKKRGAPGLDLPKSAFLNYIENHDQVANTAFGKRMWQMTSPSKFRAMTAVTLLAPNTPMLFQGEEFNSSAPFLYFADHEKDLTKQVAKGRADFMTQFPSVGKTSIKKQLPDPGRRETFERCVLDWDEWDRNKEVVELHRDLLRVRGEICFGWTAFDGAVLTDDAFVLRYFGERDRIVVVNLGRDVLLRSPGEPLLAEPEGMQWEVMWSSEEVKYGGRGTPPLERKDGLLLVGESVVVLEPVVRGS